MPHKFDVKGVEILESPDRLQFLNPDAILGKVDLRREMIIADLGCGTGYFTIPASQRVKKVYALDVQQGMLNILRNKIKSQKISNILILSEESHIPLPDNSVDVLLMGKDSILIEVKRILSGEGKLVIVDWLKIEMDFGPPFEERFTAEEVISICERNGFEVREQSNAGPYNYLLIFFKKERFPADNYFRGYWNTLNMLVTSPENNLRKITLLYSRLVSAQPPSSKSTSSPWYQPLLRYSCTQTPLLQPDLTWKQL